jgi:hypothetical protein
VTEFIGGLVVAAILLAIGIELAVLRSRKRKPKRYSHRHARRQPLLEDRMSEALVEPQTQYGHIFESYMIWKKDQETRMELFTGDAWLNLNDFTRAIVLRHIWRTLEKLARGSIVAVDSPAQEWTAAIDKAFDDRGIDPWGTPAPQAVRDR